MKDDKAGVRRQRRRSGFFKFMPRRIQSGAALRLPPHSKSTAGLILLIILSGSLVPAQKLSREQWGAMPVTVAHQNGSWIITGAKNKVTLIEKDLALTVEAGSAKWVMVPSAAGDLLAKSSGEE